MGTCLYCTDIICNRALTTLELQAAYDAGNFQLISLPLHLLINTVRNLLYPPLLENYYCLYSTNRCIISVVMQNNSCMVKP